MFETSELWSNFVMIVDISGFYVVVQRLDFSLKHLYIFM